MDGRDYWRRSGRQLGRRSLLRAGGLATAGIGTAVLLGCGGRKSTSGGANTGPATSGSRGGQPQKGGVLAHWINTDPSSLDVHQTSTYVAAWPEAACYNQIVQFDPQNPDTKIIPDLADSYEIAGDGKSIVFKLHPGIKFHDGADFSSEDVKANIDWVQNPPAKKPSPRQGVLDAIDHIETPDPLMAKIILKRPNPSLLANLATIYMGIGAKADLEQGDLGTKMNGTGPFRLKSYARGVGVELERNPDYWVKDRPYLDGLKFSIVPDESTGFANFLAGQFQRYFPVQPENIERVTKETGGKAMVYSPLAPNRDEVFFNGAKKPYNDPRVRQAVSLVLDRQAGVDLVLRGKAAPGGYMKPGGQWAISSDQLKKVPGYDKPDLAEAKKLLAAAGVTEPVSGTVLTRTDVLFQAFATYVQGSLQKAFGWNYKLDVKDSAAGYAAGYAGQFDLMAWTIGITTDDPDATFAEIAITKAARNWSKIYDTEADALFEQQSQTLDPAQRRQLVQQLETKFLNDFQVVTVYFQDANHGLWNQVQNYKLASSLFVNQRYQDVWLSKA